MRPTTASAWTLPSRLASMGTKQQYLLLDLNGTVHIGDDPTPGALEALKRLRAASAGGTGNSGQPGVPFQIRFCSNSSKESSESLALRLRKMGFQEDVIPRSELFTSLDACAELCKSGDYRPFLMLNPSAQSIFPDATSFKPDSARSPKDLSKTEWEQLKSCDSVLIGLAPGLMRHEWLDESFRLLSGEYGIKAKLIGTHRAMYLRPAADQDGRPSALSLGPGAFLSGLEAAAGLNSEDTIVVGKPQPTFFAECLKGMGWSPDGHEPCEAWIVGDDAVQDLSIPVLQDSSIKNPLRGLTIRRALVRTGKYRSGDEGKPSPLPGSAKVDGVWDDFSSWVNWFLTKHPNRTSS